MSQATRDQVQDILANGLMNFTNATDDLSGMVIATLILRDVEEVFFKNIRADDTCLFAFPSTVVLPDIRVECFIAVLTDRVIAAWRQGLVFKKTVSRIIPKHTIKQVSWAVVHRPGVTRGRTPMLTIIADNDRPIEFAMPKDKPAVADAIVETLRTSTEQRGDGVSP